MKDRKKIKSGKVKLWNDGGRVNGVQKMKR